MIRGLWLFLRHACICAHRELAEVPCRGKTDNSKSAGSYQRLISDWPYICSTCWTNINTTKLLPYWPSLDCYYDSFSVDYFAWETKTQLNCLLLYIPGDELLLRNNFSLTLRVGLCWTAQSTRSALGIVAFCKCLLYSGLWTGLFVLSLL